MCMICPVVAGVIIVGGLVVKAVKKATTPAEPMPVVDRED